MNYHTNQKVSFLERRLTNFESDAKAQFNRQFFDNASAWNPVEFIRAILKHCSVSHVLVEAELSDIEHEFTITTGLQSPMEQVISKYWLRIVLGIVEIPASVRSALITFNEVSQSLDYFRFLLTMITNKDNRNVTETVLLEAIERYRNDNGIMIDIEHDIFKKYATKKESIFQIAHPVYYKNFVEFETAFRFLDFISKKTSHANQPVLKIQSDILQELVNVHKQSYPTTPGIEELEKENVFVKSDTESIVNFNDYWSYFGDVVAASMLVRDDKEVLDQWLSIWFSQQWSRNVQFHIPLTAKEKFLESITTKLLSDSDFVLREDEVSKVRRDGDHDMHYLDDELFTRPDQTFAAAGTLYEICYTADQISNHQSSNILFIQGVRQNASRMLRLVVGNDDYFQGRNFHFVKKLLVGGIDRPYFVYETQTLITRNRPAILPHLLLDLTFVNYALYIVAHLEIPTSLVSIVNEEQQVKENTLHEIWRASFNIYGNVISDHLLVHNGNVGSLAARIFETFTLVCRLRYDNSSGFAYQKRFWESSQMLNCLEIVGKAIKEGFGNKEFYTEIVKCIVPHRSRKVFDNVGDLPLSELHGLLILGEWLTESKHRDLALIVTAEIRDVLSIYFKERQSGFGQSKKSLKSFPWGSLYRLLVTLNHVDILVFMPEIAIDQSLHSASTKTVRHEQGVRFQVDRIRTYFAIISEIFRDLAKMRMYESRLTHWYEDFINKYTLDAPAEGRLNVFHETYDVNNSLITTKLLPELLYDINYFTDSATKTRMIELLMQRLAFSQLVEMYHEISSENERELIKSKIEAADVGKLIEESSRSVDFDRALRILAWENLLKEKLITYIDKLKQRRKKSEDYLLFQLQLYLHYHDGDLSAARNLALPENLILGYVESDVRNERSLFEALILAKLERLDESDQIFSQLFSVQHRIIYRVNLFLNKINALKKEFPSDDRDKRIRQTLQDWQDYKQTASEKDQTEFESIFWYYELLAFSLLSQNLAFEELYAKLPMHIKMDPAYLKIRAEFLIHLGRSREADELYTGAFEYHHGRSRSLKFLEELNDIVTSSDNMQKLAGAYERLLNRKPNDFVKLVPPSINPGNKSLAEFITFELEWCLKELVKRVRSLSKIHDETKYNDILASLLSARVAGYGWTIKDNSTGNKSGGGTSPGERDIILQQNHSEIALIECMHIHNQTDAYVVKHIQKVFTYAESKIPRFVLAYYLGPSENFDVRWIEYRDRIFPNVIFPDEYKAVSTIEAIQCSSNAIRLGSSNHGNGYTLVHIGVNLNFSA